MSSDNLDTFTRRRFLTKLAKDGAKVAIPLFLMNAISCAHDPFKQDPDEFTISNFDRWYKRNRLYNGSNPNLKSPHRPGNFSSFRATINNRVTPGIDYGVPYGEEMVAAAPGFVFNVKTLNTGRAGGRMVTVCHPMSSDSLNVAQYYSYYAHLNSVYVTSGKQVIRGDRIGNVTEHKDYAKLMFKSGTNWVDPDNYGFNHGFMNYEVDVDPQYLSATADVQTKKYTNQRSVYTRLYAHLENTEIRPLQMHKESGYGACRWSYVESFRYLSTLYEVKPDYFPDLSPTEFQIVQKEFYENQPIVLTLPFKKNA